MAILFARASLPAWVVILALGAFVAPAGITTTVLLLALGVACIPAVVTTGVWKRTASGHVQGLRLPRDTSRQNDGEPPAIDDRESTAINAEFTIEDVAPTSPERR